MVRHDDECFEVVVVDAGHVVLQMLRAVADGVHYQLCDGLLFQVERSTTGGVEISVHPDKGLPRILFVWRRVDRVWQAAVEMPRDKQALAVRPYVGKSPPQLVHDSLVVADGEESPEKRRKAEMNLGSGDWPYPRQR
jgi:hypothetical protein